ncbi:unnamed protein product [Cunninghamella blakesleeana]
MKSNSFILVSKTGKKISLENVAHPCPQCKHHASVQLTRSERQLIVLNKRIKETTSVKYKCTECRWKDSELPSNEDDSTLQRYLTTSYTSLSLPSTSTDDHQYYYYPNDTIHSSSSFQF